MPEVLQNNPLIIVVIVLVLVLLIAIPVLIRRRRAGADEVLPPELGQQVDYTSLPYEEPTGLGDRFRRLSIGAKLLLFLVPLVLIVGIVIAVLTLQSPAGGNIAVQQTPPRQITNVRANVSGENKIRVLADTDLPNGASVTAALKESDQDFVWFEPQSATAPATNGKIELTLIKRKDAPMPKQSQQYMVVLSATVGDQTISSKPVLLDVPTPLRASFYQIEAVAPTSVPTAAPTATPASSTKPTATPASSTKPTATPTISLTATVFNGGNIRQRPQIEACVKCPQLHAGEVVQLLEKTADSRWYHMIAPEGTGWVSFTLLRIDGQVAKQVPIQGQSTPPTPAPGGPPVATPSGLTAKAFHGGNIRERPVGGRPLGQLHAGQTVQLLEKTADGVWYHVIAPEATGWVHVSLLTIDAQVAKQVPIAK